MALDFMRAFDNVSHTYLSRLLERYRYSRGIRSAINSLYEDARSQISVNGHLTPDIHIGCSLRQGCPLSTILYALVLNPFLILLEKHLNGIRIGPRRHKVTSIAYADDVTVVITEKKDVMKLRRIIEIYEQPTGARINWEKSKGLPIGAWNTAQNIGRQLYTDTATILGIEFCRTTEQTIDRTWAAAVRKMNGSAKDLNIRQLDIRQRIWVNTVTG
jgi:hypothetical protein